VTAIHTYREVSVTEDLNHSRGRKAPQVRQAAVIAVARSLINGKPQYAAAVAEFRRMEGGSMAAQVVSHQSQFLQRQWEHFTTFFNLDDNPRPGRPLFISHEDAMAASELLKQGKLFKRHTKGHILEFITYYTTVGEAIRLCPGIKAIVDKYNCSAHQLYAAMKRDDSDLCRRSITFKTPFDDAEMNARKAYCLREFTALGAEAFWWPKLLERRVFIDEMRISFSSMSGKHVKLYMSKHDARMHDVVRVPVVTGEEDLRVHIIMAVSSHPRYASRNGLVYWEFTTGTDYIRRHKNIEGQTIYDAFQYQVGAILCQKM